jgi:DNA gyrase/topoisomerase IV subunit B
VQHSARGSDQVVQVPVREIERMAKAMVMERRDEFLAKARASSVVQDEIRRLQAREERKRQRQLERNLQHLHLAALPSCETHDRNGAEFHSMEGTICRFLFLTSYEGRR